MNVAINSNGLPQFRELQHKSTKDDDIAFNWEDPWPKSVVCIKSFARSGTTYIQENLIENNFIVIKKNWNTPHNPNQPLPISILRDPMECISSNVIMSNLGQIAKNNIDENIYQQSELYSLFLDSFTLDIDNRVPFLFSQLENNEEKFLKDIYNKYNIYKNREFVFNNLKPLERKVINYRTNDVHLFLPTSKNNKDYDTVIEKFNNLSTYNKIYDKYNILVDKIKIRQNISS